MPLQGNSATKEFVTENFINKNIIMVMDHDELNRLVEEFLKELPDDEVLSIIGEGSFSREELRAHFHRRTSVGERLAQMVVDGNLTKGSLAKSATA